MQKYLLRLHTRMLIYVAITRSKSLFRFMQDSCLGDLGPEGINTFYQTHECDELGRELNLSKLRVCVMALCFHTPFSRPFPDHPDSFLCRSLRFFLITLF
jgi:hypothetical protein